MDFILLALLCLSLVALATIAWYMRKQLRRFEARFSDFKSLRFMPDRIQALGKEIESMQVAELHDEIESMQAALRRIEDLTASPQATASESVQERPQMVRALVTRELLSRNYADVVIDSSDEDLSAAQVQVAVTAKRRGASVNGVVVVNNGIVGDINLKAHYTTFP